MSPWTIRDTIRLMFAAIRQQPLRALLALLVVPTLWWIPAERLQSALFPIGPDDVGRPPLAIAFGWLVCAWLTVWAPGQVRADLDAIRGERIRWRPFVQLLNKAPALFVAGIIVSLPMDLFDLVPLSPESAFALVPSSLGFAVTSYLMARTSLWTPILVDTSTSFWDGLTLSWNATRGHTLRLYGLGCVFTLFMLPVLGVEGLVLVDFFPVTFGLLGVFYGLAVAQLYGHFRVNLAGTPGEAGPELAAAASEPAPVAEEKRESGAGWSRPIRRD